jgi:NADH dehydrogenase FAD-containing subunit
MLPEIMAQCSKITKNHMDLLLEARPITIMENVPVTAVHDECVEVRLKSGKLWGIPADLVVYAAGVRAHGQDSASSGPAMKVTAKSGIIPEMSMKAEEVHIIGDCTSVARILEATAEGERIGRWL